MKAKINIAVVDDSRTTFMMLKGVCGLVIRQVLEGANITSDVAIHHYENGDAAIKSLADRPVDFIFLDIHMPIMDGVEFINKYRELECDCGWNETPVIVNTTEPECYLSKHNIQHMVQGYSPKPFDKDVIAKHLKYMLFDKFTKVLATSFR